MKIYEINVSSGYRQIVDYIKKGLQDIFSRSHASESDIYAVNYFPAVTDGFGVNRYIIIKLATPTNDFSKEIIELEKSCHAEIFCDAPIMMMIKTVCLSKK